MGNLLWSGDGEDKKDHFVGCDLVCKPEEDGGLDFGSLVSKNISLVGKWL